MKKITFYILMVALSPLAAAAELSKAPVVVVPASDPRIQYIGRFDVSKIASPTRTRYEIPRPLGNGPHTISVFKRTEAVVGVCTFLGFELSEGGKLVDPPPRPARRIEFVGDSITAGLDVVKVGANVFTLAAENNRLDYSSVAARRLGAESTCIAYSGNGVH